MVKKHVGPGLVKVVENRAQGLAKKRVFRFYEDEYAAWQAQAEKVGVSLTAWVRHACERYLKQR